jgi:hypothetical protein
MSLIQPVLLASSKPEFTESPPGTTVTTLGNSTTTIGGAIYASATPGSAPGSLITIGINSAGQILVNSGSGFVNVGGANVIELYYASNHTCYQENSSLNWYGPVDASTTGTQVTNPIPLINSISATPVSNSPSSYPSTGVEIATLSAAVSGINGSGSYTTFTGNFSIAAGSSAGFSINNSVSPAQIVTNGVTAPGNYNLNVTATQTGTIGGVTVPPYTTPSPISVTVGSASRQTVTLGAYITTSCYTSGSSYWSTLQAHWAGFISALGITPPIMGGGICANYGVESQLGFPVDPSTWPSVAAQNFGTPPNPPYPISGLSPKPAKLMMTWAWSDNNGNTLYNDMAGVTSTLYGGKTIANWVGPTLAAIQDAGFNEVYVRPCWEWNINNPWAQGLGAAGISAATFATAMQNFYTAVKTYANANGMIVHVCWNASVFGQQDEDGNTLASQFPNQNPGQVAVDVVCADFYSNGSSELANTPPTNNKSWTLTAIVALAAQWGLPFGICECGGLAYPDGGAPMYNTWLPNLVSYVNSLTTPCAFISLWDVNTGNGSENNLEFTAPGANQPGIIAAWKAALGPGGSMTTPSSAPPFVTPTAGVTGTTYPPPGGAVTISAGANIQTVVNAHPAGTAFLLSAGTYSNQTVSPTAGSSFYGQSGAIMDGGGTVTNAFAGQGVNNVTISGITFQNYAPPTNGIGVLGLDSSAAGWTVQACTFTGMSAGPAVMLGANTTMKDCYVFNNQLGGIGAFNVTGGTVRNNNIYANNQSQTPIFTPTGDAAGIKIATCTNVTISNNYIYSNLVCPAVWTDIGCVGTMVQNNILSGNGGPGMIDEIDYGATITGNLIENNNNPALDGFEGGGLYIQNSQNATVSGNYFDDNVGGVWLYQSSRGSGRNGPYVVNNDIISNNIIRMTTGNNGYDSSVATGKFAFNTNTYYLSGTAALVAGGTDVTPAQWQAGGNDVNGSFN